MLRFMISTKRCGSVKLQSIWILTDIMKLLLAYFENLIKLFRVNHISVWNLLRPVS